MTTPKQTSLEEFARAILGVAEHLRGYGVGTDDPGLRVAMAVQITQLYKDGSWSYPQSQNVNP